jgi:hypothetical protein
VKTLVLYLALILIVMTDVSAKHTLPNTSSVFNIASRGTKFSVMIII